MTKSDIPFSRAAAVVSRKSLSRRTLLRGCGAALALPWLDSMLPAFGAAAAAKAPVRLGFIYVPNGIIDNKNQWTPLSEGPGFQLPSTLKELDPYRDRLLVLSGLAQVNGRALGDGPGDHARAGATWLTGVHPKKTEGAGIQAGPSADQIAATELGRSTPVASLEIGIEKTGLVGGCDSGYSCAYTNTLSWRSATTPLPTENNPRVVFERLFNNTEDATAAAARQARMNDRRSILDFVRNDAARLARELGAADRSKVEEYLDAVRDTERRIQLEESKSAARTNPGIEKPKNGAPDDYDQAAKLMLDLATLAYRTDSTRVVSIMFGREGSNRTYRNIGIADGHHSISHHQNDAEKISNLVKINQYHVHLFAYFLEKLRAAADGEGRLIDNVMVLYGSSLGDGNAHTHHNLPVVLAGGGGGSLLTGRHLKFPKETPMNNLLVSMLDRVGIPANLFGDATGRLTRLSEG